MPTFELKIKMDNAAFTEDPDFELQRIIGEVSEKLSGISKDVFTICPIFDINGNKVGAFTITD